MIFNRAHVGSGVPPPSEGTPGEPVPGTIGNHREPGTVPTLTKLVPVSSRNHREPGTVRTLTSNPASACPLARVRAHEEGLLAGLESMTASGADTATR